MAPIPNATFREQQKRDKRRLNRTGATVADRKPVVARAIARWKENLARLDAEEPKVIEGERVG